MDELRSTIMAQEDLIASKRRFGLFSQPPPLAVGDDGPYTKRKSIIIIIKSVLDKMGNQKQTLLKC